MIWLIIYLVVGIASFIYCMWCEWIDDREKFCPSFWLSLVAGLLWFAWLPCYGFVMREWKIKIPGYLNLCDKMDALRDKKGW